MLEQGSGSCDSLSRNYSGLHKPENDSVELKEPGTAGKLYPSAGSARTIHNSYTINTTQRLTEQYPKSSLLSLLYSPVSASQRLKVNKSPRIELCITQRGQSLLRHSKRTENHSERSSSSGHTPRLGDKEESLFKNIFQI